MTDPYLFWRALKAPFVGKASSTLGGCHTALWSQTYSSKSGIGDLCSRIETCANEIHAFGKRPADVVLVACLVRSLPQQFELTVDHVQRQCPDNFEAAKIELINRETELREKSGSSSPHVGFVHAATSTERTFVRHKQKDRKKKSGPALLASSGGCFNCGQEGHRVSDCQELCTYSSAHSSHVGKDCMRRKGGGKHSKPQLKRGRGGNTRRGARGGGPKHTVTFSAVSGQPKSIGFVGMMSATPKKKMVSSLHHLLKEKNSLLGEEEKSPFFQEVNSEIANVSATTTAQRSDELYTLPGSLPQVVGWGRGADQPASCLQASGMTSSEKSTGDLGSYPTCIDSGCSHFRES